MVCGLQLGMDCNSCLAAVVRLGACGYPTAVVLTTWSVLPSGAVDILCAGGSSLHAIVLLVTCCTQHRWCGSILLDAVSKATDAIWAQSGGQVSAAEVVVAAAVPGLHRSLSPHHNAGGNRGRAAQPSLVAGGSTKKRRLHNHIPVANRHRFYHAKWGSKARQCDRCTWTPGN